MKLRVDPLLLIILGTLTLGLLVPLTGPAAQVLDIVTKVGVFVLFLGYGARLSAAETLAGVRNWKLHLAILGTTFVVFPLIAAPLVLLPDGVLTPPIRAGLIFLCLVPSTVQSSITFTSLAGGNVPAAMVSATASNVLGVVLTPMLAILFIPTAAGGPIGLEQVWGVVVQLLLPFILGQLSRPLTATFMARHQKRLKYLDQGVIMLIVFGAFSELRASGAWRELQVSDLVLLVPMVLGLLAFMFWFTWSLGAWLGMPRADRITVMFCGTKKSLATGVPMASVLFGGAVVGVLVIPLMLYHQAQLLTGSVLASRLRQGQED